MIINKVMTNHDPVIGECLRDSVKQREIREQTGEKGPDYEKQTDKHLP